MTWNYIILEGYCFKDTKSLIRGKGKFTVPPKCPNSPCSDCLDLKCRAFGYADVTDVSKDAVLREDDKLIKEELNES